MDNELAGSIIDAMPFGIHHYKLDDVGDLIFCGFNQSANVILGVDHEIFMQKRIGEAFPDLLGTDIPEHYRITAQFGTPWSAEQIVYADGMITGAFYVTAFQLKKGEMIALFEDITQRKKGEAQQKERGDLLEQKVAGRTAELVKANTELRELSAQLAQSGKQAALGELTSGLAHELSQPLNGIKIISQGLLRDIVKQRLDQNTLGEKLMAVVDQAAKMGGILQHMRVFSQNIVGPASKACDVNHIVQDSLIFFEQQMLDNKIEIIKNFANESLMVMAVDIEVEHVVVNILSNARYALIKSGKSEKKLIVSVSRRDALACIEIEDHGQGMSQDTVKKLFTPFFTTKQPGDGTGLALSVSKKIMEKFGGRIEVVSKIGEYSRFSLLLPLAL